MIAESCLPGVESRKLGATFKRDFGTRITKVNDTGTLYLLYKLVITNVLPPGSRFSAGGGHGEKKQQVLARLGVFFERFFGLGSNRDE